MEELEKTCIQYEYNRIKLLAAFMPLQLILIFLLWFAFGLKTGMLSSNSPNIAKAIVLFGFIMYLFFMFVLIRLFIIKNILKLYKNGMLIWFDGILIYRVKLSSGTNVKFNDTVVEIQPAPKDLKKYILGSAAIIKLPKGLKKVGRGTIIIL